MPPEDNPLNQPLGGPAYELGTRESYDRINQENRNQEEATRAYKESERIKIESMGSRPPGLDGLPDVRPASGSSHKLLSKALLITIPLGALLYFFPKNGKDVQIPGEFHFFFALVIAALGSPRLRPLAIGIVILVVLFVVAVTIWTNHTLLHH